MDKWLYRVSIGLVLLGLLVSIYMTIYKITSNESMCLGSGDCSTVNSSRYSEVNGFPVAAIGVIGYGAILGVLALEKTTPFFRRNSTLLVFGMALTGFLFTAWLVYVEIALIHALCPFCIVSQIAMAIFFVISIARLIREPQY